jgi:hypothetical protein
MIHQRLRVDLAAVAIATVAAAIVMAVAGPVAAAETLRITSPTAGSQISGDVVVDGTIAGGGVEEVTISLAPQSLGDCGSAVLEATLAVDLDGTFTGTLSTTGVADGTYCLIAIAGGGSFSSANADIVVDNSAALQPVIDVQLPTLAHDAGREISAAASGSGGGLDDGVGVAAAAMPVVLVAAAILAALVIVLGVALRPRRMR